MGNIEQSEDIFYITNLDEAPAGWSVYYPGYRTDGTDISSITTFWVLVHTAYFKSRDGNMAIQELYRLNTNDTTSYKRICLNGSWNSFVYSSIRKTTSVYQNLTVTYIDVTIDGQLIAVYNSNLDANSSMVTSFSYKPSTGQYRIYFNTAPTTPIQVTFLYK